VPATVITATFLLEQPELKAVTEQLGPRALSRPEVVLRKGYAQAEDGSCELLVDVPLSEAAIVQYLVEAFQVPDPLATVASKMTKLAQLATYLKDTSKRQEQELKTAVDAANQLTDQADKAAALEYAKALIESEQSKALRAKVSELLTRKNLGRYVWETCLAPNFPKFLYFDEYYQMEGRDNIQALKERQKQGKLKPSDHPLLGLIDLARLDLDQLLHATRTQGLKNKLQGASNHLSSKILKYWSQNKHLRMNFDVRPGLPNDPPGMQSGINIWGEVFDAKHLISTGLHTRSTGFVWFFSFLAWYSAQKKQDQPLVLLLDEPGMSLHAKAQGDLIEYFEAEIATNPRHQLIYTTHSPFMVDVRHFERVRIVQDRGIDTDEELPRELDGTKVLSDVLDAGEESLFPLHGALGYELHQSLFIGPNCLVVEGAPDLLYLQAVSSVLQSRSRIGLDTQWTITPLGGAYKVPTFAALAGAQRGLKVATLIDFQKASRQLTDNIYKRKLLDKTHVLTFADFTGTKEADVEDMFGDDFYLGLVNAEYDSQLSTSDLNGGPPRILVRLKTRLQSKPLPNGAAFDPYRPARRLSERLNELPIPDTVLDRFEAAFKQLNALL
jgi:hypothetical protein